jgi:hypothetical protein
MVLAVLPLIVGGVFNGLTLAGLFIVLVASITTIRKKGFV